MPTGVLFRVDRSCLFGCADGLTFGCDYIELSKKSLAIPSRRIFYRLCPPEKIKSPNVLSAMRHVYCCQNPKPIYMRQVRIHECIKACFLWNMVTKKQDAARCTSFIVPRWEWARIMMIRTWQLMCIQKWPAAFVIMTFCTMSRLSLGFPFGPCLHLSVWKTYAHKNENRYPPNTTAPQDT